MVKKSNLLKRTVVRLLLFGIPFGLSYLATRPAAAVPAGRAFVVCAYPTDRPGELRISLDPAGCAQEMRVSDNPRRFPVLRNTNDKNDKEVPISF